MKFYISDTFTSGSGQEFNSKPEFLEELSRMIDDCEENGGTYFDVTVDTDESCFDLNEDSSEDYDDDGTYLPEEDF